MVKPRARELGLPFNGVPGKFNAITDVEGVAVGFTTLNDSKKHIRTGVTAIVPRFLETGKPSQIWAGTYALNGNGEMTGTHWINDAGYFMGPICITETHGVGAAHTGATKWMIQNYKDYFDQQHAWAMPVVAETYSGVLSDINGMHIQPEHAVNAINNAKIGAVDEGSVGGGNGMVCYEYKGGTGTSSREINLGNKTYTVGAIVQANHGIRPWLTICGKKVGELLLGERILERELGSIIVVVATDAPLLPIQLKQVAKRIAIGIGRGGSPGGNDSGDIFLAFSTANNNTSEDDIPALQFVKNERLDQLYMGVIEAVEESVINALVAGERAPCVKPVGKWVEALPTDQLKQLFSK